MRHESQQGEVSQRDLDKIRALEYFTQNDFERRVLKFWIELLPKPFEIVRQAISSLETENLQNWTQTIENNPQVRKVKNELNHLAGVTYEYLAYAYLKTTAQIKNFDFQEMTTNFDEIIDALRHTSSIEIGTNNHTDFNGKRVSWQKDTLVIPDGLMFLRSTQNDEVVAGVFESQLFSRSKNIEPVWLFVELLRSRPEIRTKIAELFGSQNFQLLPDSEFQYLILVKNNLRTDDRRRIKKMGWQVMKTPFSYYDATYQAAQIVIKNPNGPSKPNQWFVY